MKQTEMIGPALSLATQDPKGLVHLLESGVRQEVRVGGTLAQLLCDQIGIPRDYLDDRIQTLFLNAKAVDNVDTARVTDGAVIALSAAMPGLVGATLRKGGTFSGLRAAISQGEASEAGELTLGTITLKLFNLVAREMGLDLLARGVVFPGRRLVDFLATAAPADLQIHLDEGSLDCQQAVDLCSQHQWIGVRLTSG
jgi:hypothetical protein